VANIAVFIDGTWNQEADVVTGEHTNVYSLYLATCDDQERRHFDGIGTDHVTRPSQVINARVRNWIGGAFGLGMGDRIKDAYRFLSKTYKRGDHVYLFGFSRGAFAARSLAGFVDAVGLLLKDVAEEENYIETAYAAYENDTDREHNILKQYLRDLEFPVTPQVERTDLPIYFLGVWDTVPALGLSGRAQFFTAPFTEHHQTELPTNVTHARHALPLHELRSRFAPLLWSGTSRAGQTLQQVWFPGAHSDVGGGYPQTEHEWSDRALDWMAAEAAAKGLRLKGLARPNRVPTAAIHNSITGLFATATPTVRSALVNCAALPAATSSTFAIHAAAFERMRAVENINYAFGRADVNDRLAGVDQLTIWLDVWLAHRAAAVDAARAAAAEAWWADRTWSMPRALGNLWELSASLPQVRQSPTAFERALLVQVVAGRGNVPEALAADFEAATSKHPATDDEAVELVKRLYAIGAGIEAVILVLPDSLTKDLSIFRETVRSAAASTHSDINRRRLRKKFEKRGPEVL